MFSKFSRYRKVPDITAPDSHGRTIAAKDLRLLPDVTGTFLHTVNAGDRLDQLAYTYYSQPLQWWNICDGNPVFLSPLTLLDKDAVTVTRFPVTVSGAPPWSVLVRAVRGILGVENIQIVEEIALVPKQVSAGGQTITEFVEQFSRAVLVTYNKLNVTAATLATSIEAAGFQVAPFSDIGQVGQEIIVPPKPIG